MAAMKNKKERLLNEKPWRASSIHC